jgi:hypothetical protein
MIVYFYKNKNRLFDRLVSWWTRGPYSHVEIQLKDGYSYSSSSRDGGVRKKVIDFNPDRWDAVHIQGDETLVRRFFYENIHRKYDYWGLFGFVYPTTDKPLRWFCSEIVAASLGYSEPWRFSPNDLYSILNRKEI